MVRPIDTATNDQFLILNDAMNAAQSLTDPSKHSFSPQIALSEFAEVLMQRDTIVQAAIQNDIMAISSATDTMMELALRSYAFDVDIASVTIPAPSPTGSTNELTAWRVTWTADNEATSDSFIADTLSLTNEVARQRLSQ